MCGLCVEGADGLDYGLLLVFAEFGVEGEGEDLGGGGFGVGEVAGLVAEGFEGGLEVEGKGVVDFAADVVAGEVFAECIAAGGSDDVLVEDVAGAGVGEGEDNSFGDGGAGEAGVLQELVVAGGEMAALLIPAGEVAEFDFEDGGLERVEAGVPADLIVVVATGHAVGTHAAGVGVECGGGGGDEACVAHGAEVFGGVKAEGGEIAEGSGGDGVPCGSEGLGGVFDEEEIVLVLESGEGIHIGALAVEVDWEDGFHVVGGGGLEKLGYGGGAEVEGCGVDIGEEDAGTGAKDGRGRGKKAEGRGDDGSF